MISAARLQSIRVKHSQLILYGIIGASGALLDVSAYVVLYRYAHITPAIASFLSVSIGILNNFVLNARHNFKVNDYMLRRFANFYLVGIGGALLSALLIFILNSMLNVGPLPAKLITIPPVVLLQFWLNRRYSFRSRTI